MKMRKSMRIFEGFALVFAITELFGFELGLNIALLLSGSGMVVAAFEAYKNGQKKEARYLGIGGILVIILDVISFG